MEINEEIKYEQIKFNCLILFLVHGILLFLLLSCKTSQDYLYGYPNNSHIRQDLSNLNGRYFNYPKGIEIDYPQSDYNLILSPSLSQLLLDSYFTTNEWGKRPPYEGEIEIIVLPDNNLKITHIDGNNVIERKILKGKFIHNYYSVNMNKKFICIPILFFSYQEKKVDLGLSAKGDLLVYVNSYVYGAVFVFMGPSAFSYELTFERK
jgi:hypothetical protein